MIIEFDKSFTKSLDKINQKNVKSRLLRFIEETETAHSIFDLHDIKKLSGFKNYYRVRIGDYRIGIELINSQKIKLIIICHRKDIYKNFP